MSKIGIMGGTFNPPHLGHIKMAQSALKNLSLDKVIFMTGGNPPHKDGFSMLKADIRHAMVLESIKGIDGLFASEYEITKKEYSYTADTLEYLKKKNPEDELFFILGADSLDYIDRWFKPEKIFKLSKVVTFARKGYDCQNKKKEILEKFGVDIIFLEDDIPDISSTTIRTYADMGLSLSGFVAPGVYDMIKEGKFYEGEFSKLRCKVQNELKPERFLHTLGVCKMAAELSKRFGEDVEKAYKAALLHDCAKNIPKDEMYSMCEKSGVFLDEFEKKTPSLVHAKLGAYLVKEKYKIDDEDIINAVKWHTLGRVGMTKLEKIIFVADMIEEGRNFKWAEEIRKKGFDDLDNLVSVCADSTIQFNEGKGNELHPNAYMVRDYYKK